MIRPVLTEIGIFLIPFAAYVLFLLATRSGVMASSSWPAHLVAKLVLGSLRMVVTRCRAIRACGALPTPVREMLPTASRERGGGTQRGRESQ